MENTILRNKKKAAGKQLPLAFKFMLISAIYILLPGFCSFAQAPEFFRYQAVVRNSERKALANKNVDLQVRLLQGKAMQEVFTEEHKTKTNDFGLVVLKIGDNNAGEFKNIDWGNGTVFVELSMKDDHEEYTVLGTTQLLSVPYALYAKEIENKDDGDADSLNEIQHLMLDSTKLTLTGTEDTIDLSVLSDGVNDDDTSVVNELIDSMTIENNRIFVYESNNITIINIDDLVKDADSISDNELIEELSLNQNSDIKIVERNGNSDNIFLVALDSLDNSAMNIDDADADSTYELQEMSIVKDRLNLHYPPGSMVGDSVDLSDLKQDNQQLHLVYAGNDSVVISIDRGNSITIPIEDNDADSLNEIQNLVAVLDTGNNAGGFVIESITNGNSADEATNKFYVDAQSSDLEDAFENLLVATFVNTDTDYEFIAHGKAGLLKDGRDGHIYRIKKFGDTWWMQDDMDFEGGEGYGRYHEYSDYKNAYGKYYVHADIDTVCPKGWEVPLEEDFDSLRSHTQGLSLEAGGDSGADLVYAEYFYAYGSGSSAWGEGIVYHAGDLSSKEAIKLEESGEFNVISHSLAIDARLRCIKKE